MGDAGGRGALKRWLSAPGGRKYFEKVMEYCRSFAKFAHSRRGVAAQAE